MSTVEMIGLAFSLITGLFVLAILMWSANDPWMNGDSGNKNELAKTRITPRQENGR